MPKPKETESEYVDIASIPSGHKGQKEIPQEWISMVQAIPEGKAKKITDLKVSTVQGRIKALKDADKIDSAYKVMQRKEDGQAVTYIAHTKPEE